MRLFFILLLYLCNVDQGVAQRISLDPITELHCNSIKGSLKVNFSNRGLDPLKILELKSSHKNIQISPSHKSIRSGSMGFFFIEYNFSDINEEDVVAIVIKTNDYKKPKVTLLLNFNP